MNFKYIQIIFFLCLGAFLTSNQLNAQVTPMAGNPVKGWDATYVKYCSADRRIYGSFEKTDGKNWKETNNQGTNYFVETHRDEWSVYLNDASRGVRIQLDLWVKKVKIAPYNSEYIVTAAKAGPRKLSGKKTISPRVQPNLPVQPMVGNPVKGWDASFVKYCSADRKIYGSFTQTGGKNWKESNNQGTNYFVETHRDEWSVYLNDAGRGIRVQLDLWVKKVKVAPYNSEYIVTEAK